MFHLTVVSFSACNNYSVPKLSRTLRQRSASLLIILIWRIKAFLNSSIIYFFCKRNP